MGRKALPPEDRQQVRLITAVTPDEASAFRKLIESKNQTVSDALRAWVQKEVRRARRAEKKNEGEKETTPAIAPAAPGPQSPGVARAMVWVEASFPAQPDEATRSKLKEGLKLEWKPAEKVWRGRIEANTFAALEETARRATPAGRAYLIKAPTNE